MRLTFLLLWITTSLFGQEMMLWSRVPASTEFSPTDIPNLELWLDGADTDGDFTLNEETGVISTWYDKSGNGYDFTSSGSPVLVDGGLNANDYVDFDGTNDYFDSDESSSSGVWNFLHDGTKNTIFLVLNTGNSDGTASVVYITNRGTSSNIGTAFTIDDRNINPAFNVNASAFQIARGVSNENVVLDYLQETVFPNNTYLFRIETDPTNSTASERYDLFINDISQGASNASTFSPTISNSTHTLRIGMYNDPLLSFGYLDGYIAEILMYSKELTPQEISDVETYLNNKWLSFSPTNISGLELWLDGSDVDGDGVQEGTSESTLTGTEVTDWNDKSSNSFVFSKTGSPQLESVSGTLYKVTSDGDDYFVADNPASSFNFLHQDDITTFLVLELDNASPNIPTNYLIYTTLNSSATNTGGFLSWRRSNFNDKVAEREFAVINANSTSNRVMYHGMDASSMTTNNNLYMLNFSTDVDGIGDDRIVDPKINTNSVIFGNIIPTPGTASTSNASYPMYLMNQPSLVNNMEGSIAELIIYDRILTPQEISNVEDYLVNKWFGPQPIQDGLVLHLDASNPASYPGTGTTWTDLSPEGNDGILKNGVAFDGTNLVFDGVNDLVDDFSSIISPIGDRTVMVYFSTDQIANRTGLISTRPRTLSPSNGWFIVLNAVDQGSVTYAHIGVSGGSIDIPSNDYISANQKYLATATYNSSSNEGKLYLNNSLSVTKSFGNELTQAVPFNGAIANEVGNGILRPHNGKIEKVLIYDRVLSEGEVKQNYNAMVYPYPPGYTPCEELTEIVDVTSTTGAVWMDRNLGASRVATSSTDAESYGDLYQWGRFAEGHQCRNSSTTTTNATTAAPNAGNSWDGLFITPPSSPYNWLTPQDNNLWQGVNGVNNPCPSGYRIPSEAEWEIERGSWSSNNSTGAYASPLKLTLSGSRSYGTGGPISYLGVYGFYWSSSVSGIDAKNLRIYNSDASMRFSYRANGFEVRCIKD